MCHKHQGPHHRHLPTVTTHVLLINNAPDESQEKCGRRCKVKELIDSFHRVFMA